MAIISLGLFGMEEASVETEDPFGTDENCLDMVTYTLTVTRDTGQMAANKGSMQGAVLRERAAQQPEADAVH